MSTLTEALVIAASSGAVVTSLSAALSSWLRARRSEVTIEVKLNGTSIKLSAHQPDEAAKIIEAFVAEHAPERGQDD